MEACPAIAFLQRRSGSAGALLGDDRQQRGSTGDAAHLERAHVAIDVPVGAGVTGEVTARGVGSKQVAEQGPQRGERIVFHA